MGGLSAAMNWKDDSRYKLRLAQGFFDEAIENVAKAIISCFIPISKSHSFGDALNLKRKRKNEGAEVEIGFIHFYR